MKRFLIALFAALVLVSFASCISKGKSQETTADKETTETTTKADTTEPDTSSDVGDQTTSGDTTTETPTTEPPTTEPPVTEPPVTEPPVTEPPVISYTVTFNVDGAKYSSSVSTNGSPIKFPSNPKKPGHTFIGWYYDQACTKPFTSESLKQSPLSSNITVYGKYELTTYKASFYADGALIGSVEFVYTDEALSAVPEVPAKEGYIGEWESYTLSASDITVNAVYVKTITVNIVIDNKRAAFFNAATTQVTRADNPQFTPVKVIPNLGYAFDHYTVNGESYTDATINLQNITSDTTVYVYTKYFTNELPIINIDTNDAPITNKTDYVDMVFDLQNCEGEISGATGGIRLRGNSTLGYPKKPYRIKFDKKQSLFGLEKAKSWVLLAEYIDPSQLHNHAALTLGNKMPGLPFTPSPQKVNVYLNGEYQGMYTLCEQIQENEGRMNIELAEITEGMTFSDYNWFVCLDSGVKKEVGQVLNETYIEIPYVNERTTSLCFEIKYPEKDAFPSEEQFNQFVSDLRDYLTDLVHDFDTKNAENIKAKTNINSLIDYVIIDQLMGQEDHDKWHKSFNIYYTHTSSNPEENEKVNFGPIWDYDWSLYTRWTNKPNVEYNLNARFQFYGPFFDTVFYVEEFYETLRIRFETYASPAVLEYLDSYYALVESMSASYNEDARLWYVSANLPFDITKKNIDFLYNFLAFRESYLRQILGL